jgi:hypothetical protein
MIIEFSARETTAMIRKSAAGTWLGVDWTDGPTERAVERVIERFEGRTIDGESIERLEISDRGRIVRTRYGVDLLTVTRRYSAEALRHAIASTRVDPSTVRIRRTGEGGSSDLEGAPEARHTVYAYLQDVTRPELAGSA